ncbi:type VI secretion system ImpA family N-terminal domain-containing protein [Ralstonia sp. UNC404CL21Col]|uniref:type VI secretion system protein TssA n=1 Tax=Ralstonia sp. UNC404CL21Col TaxID=1380362 RepID=UPI00055C1B28|nr:type VI secretion system ImpA family N-terminal domain-containing protein [Ralstonia sp. UNC404CL21Col]
MFFSKKTKDAQPALRALIFPELLEPISEAHPCGNDLEYDPEFVLLQGKVTPKQDAQYGDFVSPPEAINWTEVERDCRRLLLRTRDIRILILLVRCRVRLDQAIGLRDGLCILSRLLETWPETIYPQVVVDGEPDPAVRANALAALADPQGLMQDVRDLVISTNGVLRLRVRDVERSLSTARAADALAPEAVHHQLHELRNQNDAVLSALDEAQAFASSIDSWARHHLPDDYPDLGTLLRLLDTVTGASPPAASAVIALPVSERSPAAAQGLRGTAIEGSVVTPLDSNPPEPIMDRNTALASIQAARIWFEAHEPSSPVALLLKQAERLTGKRFDEVFQAIPAELVERWAREH